MADELARLLDYCRRKNVLRDDEIRALIEADGDEKIRLLCTELAEDLMSCIDYLCNFDHVVNNNGGTTEITDVHERICDLMRERFSRVVGSPLRPPLICRVPRRTRQEPSP